MGSKECTQLGANPAFASKDRRAYKRSDPTFTANGCSLCDVEPLVIFCSQLTAPGRKSPHLGPSCRFQQLLAHLVVLADTDELPKMVVDPQVLEPEFANASMTQTEKILQMGEWMSAHEIDRTISATEGRYTFSVGTLEPGHRFVVLQAQAALAPNCKDTATEAGARPTPLLVPSPLPIPTRSQLQRIRGARLRAQLFCRF